MSMHDDSVLDSQLRESVSDELPLEVEVRLRDRLAENSDHGPAFGETASSRPPPAAHG